MYLLNDLNSIVSIPLYMCNKFIEMNRLYTTHKSTTGYLSDIFRPCLAIIRLTKKWC